jgi:hypothetical protein
MVFGVGQPAICAKSLRSFACGPNALAIALSGSLYSPPAACFAVGVGQPDEPEALSDVRSADARSANIFCREGVSRCFQVSRYKIEPAEAVFACNLLAKYD